MSLIGFEDGVLGLNQLSVWKRIGKDSQEGFVLALLVEPVEGVLMNKVGRILLAVGIVVAKHGVLDVLIQNNAFHGLVARRTAVGIEEVGIVEMRLKLADVAIKLIDAAFIGRRNRTFIAASPLTEHTRGVAIVFEDFGNDNVGGVVRFLTNKGIVGVVTILHGVVVGPIFFVASHVGVSRMLTRHETGAGGS